MIYNVTFFVDIHDYQNNRYEDGVAKSKLIFLPVVGMHLGSSQLLTVCQVHWLGQNEFEVVCPSISCVNFRNQVVFENLDILKDKIRQVSPTELEWEFSLRG